MSPRTSAVSLAFAFGALALAACSDNSLVSPSSRLTPDAANLSVTLGTNSVTINSDGSTQHCTAQDAVGNWTVPASFGPFTSCGTALDLTSALAAYNPGWSAPISTSSWIGFTANGGPSSDYRPETGRYVFQETFDIPAGATAPTLDLSTLSDNAVAVYLNGHKFGGQAITDCLTAPCNWSTTGTFTATDNTGTDFVIGGSNTVTVLLVGTPIGYGDFTNPPDGTGGPAPTYGCYRVPQPFGFRGTSNLSAAADTVPTSPNHVFASRTSTIAADGTGCENPVGVDFHGTVSWTPPVVNHGCTLGFWKTHDGLGSPAYAWGPSGLTPSTTLLAAGFIGTGNDNVTLDAALSFSGGSTLQDAKNNLMKQAVAALLNASTPGMNYPLTKAQVLAQVNAALASGNKGTILALADVLNTDNSLEGPLC